MAGLLLLSAGASGTLYPKLNISGTPSAIGCGYYTMDYQIWCDPLPVTSYVVYRSECALTNGTKSASSSVATAVLPSGLLAAAACPPATALTPAMACSGVASCNIKWSGPSGNTVELCLVLIRNSNATAKYSAATVRNMSSTCDVNIEGRTDPTPPSPTSGGFSDSRWWHLLLIVGGGILLLLVGLGVLLCLWRYCCAPGAGPGGAQVAPVPVAKAAPMAVGTPAAAAAAAATTLPSGLAQVPPVLLVNAYADKLMDKTLDNPALYLPNDKQVTVHTARLQAPPGATHGSMEFQGQAPDATLQQQQGLAPPQPPQPALPLSPLQLAMQSLPPLQGGDPFSRPALGALQPLRPLQPLQPAGGMPQVGRSQPGPEPEALSRQPAPEASGGPGTWPAPSRGPGSASGASARSAAGPVVHEEPVSSGSL
ncbi:hypothetical protein GPECTOR_4g592 [Gonium pectorale]|uniref:Uncharacterized protein n=1 Tax=Gonium pectorale TaxID=33097 RepID=A0A150GXB5_GONPE|nr:hypothetical protein GPECTOR_4g592 [Gonium pectorale]|eukprot:KXZ54527.1 hypothetical protein GPECTOR_4g592 [Gonium pectorale]